MDFSGKEHQRLFNCYCMPVFLKNKLTNAEPCYSLVS